MRRDVLKHSTVTAECVVLLAAERVKTENVFMAKVIQRLFDFILFLSPKRSM